MILLVPLNPEVPNVLRPKLWPSVLMVICLSFIYFITHEIVATDSIYVEGITATLGETNEKGAHLDAQSENYLALRPLLSIAPAKGDWDVERLIKANFIHGSSTHLLLNSIGVFAGFRICMTFMPFLSALVIFLIGGTIGLWVSLLTSTQLSEYIPHVGASAGLFSLMGTYYVFNFRFRTQYFFWLPIRRGFISLKTSWFFFVDVILLELVLSAAQLFPDRVDSVDHIAHVIGFSSGVILAVGLRLFLKWPRFLQTRAEYLYWNHFIQKNPRMSQNKIHAWLELLRLNRYNDFLKLKICNSLKRTTVMASDPELNEIFKFFVPTFVRLNTFAVTKVIRTLINEDRQIPARWLSKVPYDIILRIAKSMISHSRQEYYLYRLLDQYKKAQDSKGRGTSTVEKLMAKLELEFGGSRKTESQKAS